MKTHLRLKRRWAIFSANGWCTRCNITSLAVAVNPAGGFNCYWEMPFRKHAKITLENLSDEEIRGFYYQITYTLTDVPDDAAYLHARWNRSNPLPYQTVHTLLDNVQGQGHYVGTYIAWGVNNNGWWGEGEIKFYMDDDQDYPTICGTGTEDYFGGAWNFEHPQGQYGVVYFAIFRTATGDSAERIVSEPTAIRDVPLAHHGSNPVPEAAAGDDPGVGLASGQTVICHFRMILLRRHSGINWNRIHLSRHAGAEFTGSELVEKHSTECWVLSAE